MHTRTTLCCCFSSLTSCFVRLFYCNVIIKLVERDPLNGCVPQPRTYQEQMKRNLKSQHYLMLSSIKLILKVLDSNVFYTYWLWVSGSISIKKTNERSHCIDLTVELSIHYNLSWIWKCFNDNGTLSSSSLLFSAAASFLVGCLFARWASVFHRSIFWGLISTHILLRWRSIDLGFGWLAVYFCCWCGFGRKCIQTKRTSCHARHGIHTSYS